MHPNIMNWRGEKTSHLHSRCHSSCWLNRPWTAQYAWGEFKPIARLSEDELHILPMAKISGDNIRILYIYNGIKSVREWNNDTKIHKNSPFRILNSKLRITIEDSWSRKEFASYPRSQPMPDDQQQWLCRELYTKLSQSLTKVSSDKDYLYCLYSTECSIEFR